MKHLFLLLLLTFAVHADFQLDFSKDKVDIGWWSDNKPLNRCTFKYAINPQTGKQALEATWDATVTNYMHAMIVDKKAMPAFKRAKFTAVVTTCLPCSVKDCQLRLQDKNLETWYFSHKVDWMKPGTHVLEYVIDTADLKPTSKTTFSKDNNGIIDFPLSTFALTFKMPQNGMTGQAYIDSITVTELPDWQQINKQAFVLAPLASHWLSPLDMPQRIPANATLERAANPVTGKPSLKMTALQGQGPSYGVSFTTHSSPRGILSAKIRHYNAAEIIINLTTTAPMPEVRNLKLDWFESNGGIYLQSFPIKLDKAGEHHIRLELPAEVFAQHPYGAKKPGQPWVITAVRLEKTSKDIPSSGPVFFDSIDLNVARSPLENLEFQIYTGKEAVVVEPQDAAKGVKATLTNISSLPVSCRVKGTLTDCADNAFPWDFDRQLDFAPGETKDLGTIPVPQPFGTYYADLTFSAPDLPEFTRRRSFAHMKLTGAKPDEKFVKGFKFGTVCHLNPMVCAPQEIERAAIIMSQIGLRILRVDVWWSENPLIQTWLDNVVEIYGKYGMNFDFILGYITSKDKILMDRSMTCYGNLFKRYKGKVQYWEMLNEPDIPWSRTAPPQGEDYAELAKAISKLLKSIDSKAQFMSAGYCTLNAGHKLLPYFHYNSMKLCKDDFDVHCFHGHGAFGRYANWTIDQCLLPMRKELGITIPWYANETAITSTNGCTEKDQAETLYKKLLFSWGRGAIGYTWYNLRSKGDLPDNGEFNYGMLTHELYPKAVYAAYNGLTGLYHDKEYFKTLDLPADQWGFAFKSQSEIAVAVWTLSEQSAIAIKSDAKSAEVMDIFGNRKPLDISDGIVTITSNASPQNIILKGATDFQQLPPFISIHVPSLILPGQPQPVKVTLNNPLPTARRANAKLRLPASLSCPQTVFEGTIAPASTLDFNTTITLKTMPTTPDASEWLFIETTLEGIPTACDFKKLPVVSLFQPSLDGDPLITLKDSKSVTILHPGDPAFEASVWKGADDLSAKIWLDIDQNDALVVKVVATDDQHCQKNADDLKVWNGDSVQVFITPENFKEHYQINLAHTDGKSIVDIHDIPKGIQTAPSLIKLDTSRHDHETFYLAVIPPAALGLPPNAFRTPFRFNIMVNDGDNDIREGWVAFAPGIGTGVVVDRHPFFYPLPPHPKN